ncbi:FtsQ-type POTRA domain-containing protein [Lactobacillaceae bacterium 24-114]
MDNDKSSPEHHRYSQRLSHLENHQPSSKKRRPIGNKVVGIKEKRHSSSRNRIIKLLLLFGSILVLMVYIISPLSKINKVEIKGNTELSAREVEKATTIKPGRLIWSAWVRQETLEQKAKITNPQIKSLKVKLTGPQSVSLSIKENRLLGIGQVGKHRYAVLTNGHLQLTTAQNDNIDFVGFSKSGSQLKILGQQLGKLKPAIYHGISVIKYQPTKNYPHQVVLYMKDGNTVKVNLTDIGNKMKYYPSIITEMQGQGVIDLRIGAYSYTYGSKEK